VDPPCENELKGDCGDSCIEDTQCPAGQFCDDGSCTAECTGIGDQCEGTCTSQGRCNGTVKTEVSYLPPVDTGSGILVPEPGGVSPNGEACATGVASAAIANVNMFIMFDQSSSMEQNNRWTNATNALVAFLQSPE